MRVIVRFVLFHLLCFVGATIIFVLLFRTPIISDAVFFYRGVVFLFVTTLCLVGILLGLRRFGDNASVYTTSDIILAAVLFFCFNLVIFTHLPVTAERSMTVFLLGHMNTNPKRAYTSQELQKQFVEIYVTGNNALEKRFIEQEQSGTIERSGDTFTLTKRGILLMQFYRWIADLFGVDKKNLSL